ncbi:MAG: hypothetical protein HY901_02675 [Deltaproteobacteria bacterium]|nr:hypothetical protein [Deltaproteobacteria bacterium]
MPVERLVTFLNVDLELYGQFDRQALVKALGKSVVVLHEGRAANAPLVLEVTDVGLDVAKTLAQFLKLIQRLPKKARAAWDSAERRRFDIGIQGGKRPYSTSWALSPELVAGLAACHAELAITVYGAEGRNMATASSPKRVRR